MVASRIRRTATGLAFAIALIVSLAPTAPAEVVLQVSAPMQLPFGDLVSYTISAIGTAGEQINTFQSLSISGMPGFGLGPHEVWAPGSDAPTPTKNAHASAGTLWNPSYSRYDTCWLPEAGSYLEVGTQWVEANDGTTTGKLFHGVRSPFGQPTSGFGTFGGQDGAKALVVGAGSNVPFLQLVARASDISLLNLRIYANAGTIGEQFTNIPISASAPTLISGTQLDLSPPLPVAPPPIDPIVPPANPPEPAPPFVAPQPTEPSPPANPPEPSPPFVAPQPTEPAPPEIISPPPVFSIDPPSGEQQIATPIGVPPIDLPPPGGIGGRFNGINDGIMEFVPIEPLPPGSGVFDPSTVLVPLGSLLPRPRPNIDEVDYATNAPLQHLFFNGIPIDESAADSGSRPASAGEAFFAYTGRGTLSLATTASSLQDTGSPTPEPSSLALILFAGGFLSVAMGRRPMA